MLAVELRVALAQRDHLAPPPRRVAVRAGSPPPGCAGAAIASVVAARQLDQQLALVGRCGLHGGRRVAGSSPWRRCSSASTSAQLPSTSLSAATKPGVRHPPATGDQQDRPRRRSRSTFWHDHRPYSSVSTSGSCRRAPTAPTRACRAGPRRRAGRSGTASTCPPNSNVTEPSPLPGDSIQPIIGRVEQRDREPVVVAAHLIALVELGRFDLDVAHADGTLRSSTTSSRSRS